MDLRGPSSRSITITITITIANINAIADTMAITYADFSNDSVADTVTIIVAITHFGNDYDTGTSLRNQRASDGWGKAARRHDPHARWSKDRLNKDRCKRLLHFQRSACRPRLHHHSQGDNEFDAAQSRF